MSLAAEAATTPPTVFIKEKEQGFHAQKRYLARSLATLGALFNETENKLNVMLCFFLFMAHYQTRAIGADGYHQHSQHPTDLRGRTGGGERGILCHTCATWWRWLDNLGAMAWNRNRFWRIRWFFLGYWRFCVQFMAGMSSESLLLDCRLDKMNRICILRPREAIKI